MLSQVYCKAYKVLWNFVIFNLNKLSFRQLKAKTRLLVDDVSFSFVVDNINLSVKVSNNALSKINTLENQWKMSLKL